ncbi:ricin B-like lectin, partial [Serendipita vermifera]
CLEAAGNYNGAPVSVINCPSTNSNKVWTWETPFASALGGQTTRYKIFEDKCLDVTGGNDADGNKLQIWTCYDGNRNQLWQTESDYTIHWAFHNKYIFGNKCLDVTDGKDTNGNRLQIWTCDPANTNQKW